MRKTRGTPSELSENEQSASASSPRGISANRYLPSTPQTTEFQPSPFPTSLRAALATQAAGETPPAAPTPARTVVASTKLPMVGDTPVHFKAVSVTIPSAARSSVSSNNGILFQLSGSTEVSIGGEAKTLSPGEGLFIASDNAATLKAGDGGPSIFLHFLLAPTADLDKPL